MPQPEQKRVIKEAYILDRVLGKGTFGTTHLATRRKDNKPVAVKLLHTEAPPPQPFIPENLMKLSLQEQNAILLQKVQQHVIYEEFQEKEAKLNYTFSREAGLLALLNHPNIVPLLDFDIDEGQPFIVMELALRGALKHYRQKGVPLSLDEAVDFVLQASNGVQRAHDHDILHRDLKPDNLLLQPDLSQRLTLWVADFGGAIRGHTVWKKEPQDLLGTPQYMSPEQYNREAVKASDQYALAIIAYELLTGQRPFQSDSDAGYLYLHTNVMPPSFEETLRLAGRQDQMKPPLKQQSRLSGVRLQKNQKIASRQFIPLLKHLKMLSNKQNRKNNDQYMRRRNLRLMKTALP